MQKGYLEMMPMKLICYFLQLLSALQVKVSFGRMVGSRAQPRSREFRSHETGKRETTQDSHTQFHFFYFVSFVSVCQCVCENVESKK